MKRINFIYAAFSGLLIFSFFSFLESEKATGAILLPENSEDSRILNQWVVAEATDLEKGEDITSRHSSEVWHFLRSNGFVLFKNQIIEENGSWELKNETLRISTGGLNDAKSFRIIKNSRNELVITSDELKIRLLKLETD